MLGKLFKHEFKATGKSFLLMYAVFFVITLFNKLFLEISISSNRFWSSFQRWFMILYILTCAIIFVITAVLIVSRFYKNLMCDEGYLMFTLPVTVNQHIIVKAVSAFVWMSLSFIVFLVSVFILFCGHGIGQIFSDIGSGLKILTDYFGGRIYQSILICIVAFFVGILYSILQVYMAISIGQLVNKHRVLTSIITYFAINFAIQNITGFAFIVSDSFDFDFIMDKNTFEMANGFLQYMNTAGLISILCSVVVGTIFFFATSFILNKKLNLE